MSDGPNWSQRMALARVNLRFAEGWSHVAPSVRDARIAELHEEINALLDERERIDCENR